MHFYACSLIESKKYYDGDTYLCVQYIRRTMKISLIKKWGIDIDNVILLNLSESIFYKLDDYSPEEIVQYIKIVPGALDGIKMLIKHVGVENVWLLSKADDRQRKIIKLAFEKFRIFKNSKLPKDQLIMVPEKNDKITVIRSLELEGLIDNQGQTIFGIQQFVKHPFWFAPDKLDIECWVHKLNCSVRVVSGWKQFMEIYN